MKDTIKGLALIAALAMTALPASAWDVKIMFAYTPAVSSYYGGNTNTNARIQTKFNDIATTHTNCSSGVAMLLATRYSTPYNVTNQTSSTQLTRLRTGTELADVRAIRDNNAADLCMLFCDWTDTGIVGLSATPGWNSVVRRPHLGAVNGASGQWACAHECGHNFNGQHDKGYCMTSGERTIMGSNGNTGCSVSTTINWFSSSSILKNNIATGTATYNNREVARAQAPTTAAYR